MDINGYMLRIRKPGHITALAAKLAIEMSDELLSLERKSKKTAAEKRRVLSLRTMQAVISNRG